MDYLDIANLLLEAPLRQSLSRGSKPKDARAPNLKLSVLAKKQGLEHRGGGYYGPIGNDKAATTHKSSDDGKKLVPLTPAEKKSLAKTKKEPAQKPAPQKKPTPTPASNVAGPIQVNLDKVAGNKNHPLRKDPIFLRFLQKPTKALAQHLQQQYNFVFDNGKLYTTTIGNARTVGDAQRKPFGDNSSASSKLGYQIVNNIAATGVPVTIKGSGDGTKQAPTGREAFKATNLFGKDRVEIISAEGFSGGVKIAGHTFKEIKFPENYVQLVVDRVRKNNASVTSDQLSEARNLAESAMAIHKRQIEKLKQIQDLPAYKFHGEEGKRDIIGRLFDTLQKNTNTDQFMALRQISQKLITARDVQTLRTHFSEFITKTPPELSGAVPYIAELFSAIHQLQTKGSVLIPADDSFKLADVIGLSNDVKSSNPRDLATRINMVFVDADDFEVDLDTDQGSVSTKVGKGSASSNYTKYEESEFFQSYGKKKYNNVKSDLLSVSKLRNSLFGKGGPQSQQDSMNRLTQFVDQYKDVIADYYGIDNNIDTKQLMKMLSTGRPLICGTNGKPAASPPGAPLNTNPSNANAWRAWSTLGFATDAVHNKMLNFQTYSTHVYKTNGSLHIADGLTKLSASKFQFYKNKQKSPDGNEMPDQELNAFTVPTTRSQIRSGNPCSQR